MFLNFAPLSFKSFIFFVKSFSLIVIIMLKEIFLLVRIRLGNHSRDFAHEFMNLFKFNHIQNHRTEHYQCLNI